MFFETVPKMAKNMESIRDVNKRNVGDDSTGNGSQHCNVLQCAVVVLLKLGMFACHRYFTS